MSIASGKQIGYLTGVLLLSDLRFCWRERLLELHGHIPDPSCITVQLNQPWSLRKEVLPSLIKSSNIYFFALLKLNVTTNLSALFNLQLMSINCCFQLPYWSFFPFSFSAFLTAFFSFYHSEGNWVHLDWSLSIIQITLAAIKCWSLKGKIRLGSCN